MKLLNIFLLIFSLLVISACKKQHNISIQANDLNSGSVNAYANMPFLISQSRPAWFEDKVDKVYEGVLDDNGFASFDLKMQKDWSYILSVGQPENICYGGLIGFYLENEKSNVVSFSYAKCGDIKFIISNDNCFNNNDKLEYSRTWITNSESPDETTTILGCQNLESDYYQFPAGLYNCSWTVTKNNISTSFSEDFTITAGENTTFSINY